MRRRFLFVDDRYLISADSISSPVARTYTWPVNGNGGGSDGVMPALPYKSPAVAPPEGATAIVATPYAASGGTFQQTAAGGEWTRPSARVTTGMAFDAGTPTASTADRFYEQKRSSLGQYTALLTSVSGTDVDALGIAYPTPTTQAAPVVSRVTVDGAAALTVTDAGGDARVFVLSRPAGSGEITVPASVTGSRSITTDGSLVVLETSMDGTVRSVSAENATGVTVDGGPSLASPHVSTLSLRLPGDGTAAVVAQAGATPIGSSDATAAGAPAPSGVATVDGLGFDPVAADGACTVAVGSDSALVPLFRTGAGAVTLRAEGGDQGPAADPGGTRRVAAGSFITLDGRASCDADGDALTPHWALTSAPAGSAWQLADADSWRPKLTTEVDGPYRLTLTVTDGDGRSSVAPLLVLAGSPAADQVDDDLDGVFDHADPDGDTGVPLVVTEPPPPTTTTSSTTASSSTSTTVAVGSESAPPTSTAVGGDGSSLPVTGWSALVPSLLGMALIVAGSVALASTRRRRARP